MEHIQSLLVDLLVRLVDTVPDQPRRVLFRGVSHLSDPFRTHVAQHNLPWTVYVTGDGNDLIGARNTESVQTLVVFYRDEVQERESLNAFRHFDEDAITAELVRRTLHDNLLAHDDPFRPTDDDALQSLLRRVYPSLDRL